MKEAQRKLEKLTIKARALELELSRVRVEIKFLKGIKLRPKNGQRIVATLKGSLSKVECLYGVGDFHEGYKRRAHILLDDGGYLLWGKVISWTPANAS
jgi:hypothetical protein